MTVRIRDAQHSAEDRAWIRKHYPEYLDALSRLSMNSGMFPAGMFPASGEFGEPRAETMARWFVDDSSHPLIILHNERPAGFALVSRPPPLRRQSGGRDQVDFRMAEFFVAPAARRCGVGRDAAHLIFNRFAGQWEVTEFQYNMPAVAFWRAIVADYTGGRYRESVMYGEVHQFFTSHNVHSSP